MNTKYKRLLGDTALFALGNFGSKILTFLLVPLYTSILSTSDYGTADLVTTTVNLLYPILTLSVCESTLRFVLDKNEDKHKVLSNSLLVTFVAIIALLCFTPFAFLFKNFISEYWWFLFFKFVCITLHMCVSNYVKGIGKTKIYAIQGIVYTLTYVSSNIILLLGLKVGIRGYLSSIIIAYVVALLFMIISAKCIKEIVIFKVDKLLLKRMLTYCVPLIPTSIMWWINASADKYMLAWIVGTSANGLYSVANKIPSIFATFSSIFSQAWRLSAVTNYDEKKNDTGFYSNVYNVYIILGICVCMGLTAFSKGFALLLFKKDYFIVWNLVPMLLLAALMEGLTGFLASLYVAAKKTKLLMISTFVGAIANIFLNYLLIKLIGIRGAAIATMISFFIVWIIRSKVLNSIMILSTSNLKVIVSIAIMFLSALYFSYDWPFALPVYLASILVILLINYNEFVKVIKKALFFR